MIGVSRGVWLALALGLGTVTLVAPRDAHAQVSSTVGSVRGIIRDRGAGPADGATVIATSPSLQGTQVAIAENGGQYVITALPPGLYTLTVVYGDGTFSRGNVLIQVGKEVVVNITIDSTIASSAPKGETIVIRGSVPIIDQGSTKTGATITDDYTRNVPTGRTFGAVLGASAGSTDDYFGTSIGGATSPENTFIVEGINTTDTGQGLQSSNLPNEFVQETEVITGGYNAEYGRATGGIINVVTKQGSDQFHGSVFGYLRPGAFVSSAKLIQTEGGSIDTKEDLDYAADAGGEIGGPIIKKKLWFHVGFNPSFTHSTQSRLVQRQVDENDDGVPDVGSDGYTIHDEVNRTTLPLSTKTYYFTAKLNGAVTPNHQYQLSLFGNPSVANALLGTTLIPSPTSQLYRDANGAVDVAAKWTSKLGDGKTQLDGVFGYHHGYSRQSAVNALGAASLAFYGYERSLFDFADLEGSIDRCNDNDPNDDYKGITNCPVLNYAEAGLGLLEDRTNDRITAVESITRRARLFGLHVLKAGLDVELSTYNSNATYTGDGNTYERFCNTDPLTGECSNDPMAAPGAWQSVGFSHIVRNLTPAEVANPMTAVLQPGEELCSGNRAVCTATPSLIADTRDRSIGVYLQDSYQILPYLEIDLGLRYERQRGDVAKQLQGTVSPTGEIVPTVGFTTNNWAPRAGFIFDPTKEGRSKLFGHWGRFYENIPLDLNVRGFGGEIDRIGLVNGSQLRPGDPGFDPNCNVDHVPGQRVETGLGQCSDQETVAILGGGSEFVLPGIQGQYTEELILGTEYQFAPDFKVGVTYVHRTLPSVIEDILTPDGEYFIVNPGQDYSGTAADLHAQAMKLSASSDPAKQALGKVYEYRSQQVARLSSFDKPSRNYDAVQLSLTQRPTQRSLILASYTYSKTRGNYPGLFSTETTQLNPNGSSQYDLPALLANRYGLLGLDRTHNLKVDGFYQFDLHNAGALTVGASLRAQSGIPHNALGADPVYGQGESYLLPRGSIRRSPTTGSVDVHLSYSHRLNKTFVLEGFVNVFNLINRQDELSTDENYTLDGSLPIVGGDAKDLEHLKSIAPDGVEHASTVHQNPNFAKTLTRQAPRAAQIGVRLTF